MGYEDVFRKIRVKDTIQCPTHLGTTFTATGTISGLTLSGTGQIGGYETLSTTGAISPSILTTLLSTTGPLNPIMTLADGADGAFKDIRADFTSGSAPKITPTNFKDGTTITLATGGSVSLQFLAAKWRILGGTGYTLS